MSQSILKKTNIKQYTTQNLPLHINKKRTFFSLAKESFAPKTGIPENVAQNFDAYLYAK